MAEPISWVSRVLSIILEVRPNDGETSIRLPSSAARRGAVTFLKVLRHVNLPATSGFDFAGEFLRPGRIVYRQALRPAIDYPETPVLLECAGIARAGVTGRRGHPTTKSEQLYIVWRWNEGERSWNELGRAHSTSWDWAVDLAPIAARAIDEQYRAAPDLSAIEQRIDDYLAHELERVPEPDRVRVLAVIHDAIAARLTGGRRLAFGF